jgi:N-acetylglutamate synthase-like GNAT family acetyltransferase
MHQPKANPLLPTLSSLWRGSLAALAGRFLANRVLATYKNVADDQREHRIALLEHGRFGRVLGGTFARVTAGWMYMEWLWVKDSARQRGIGSRLMQRTEAEAIRLGAHSAYLWTMSFQAPDFYLRHGYEQFTTLDNTGANQYRIGFKKQLRPPMATPDLSEGNN